MKKIFLLFCLICISSVFVAAQDSSLAAANRRTATRYLSRAESALAMKNWEAALANAEMGLAYDDGIADLWYVMAQAENGRGTARAVVLPLVGRAISGGGQWVDYNRDGARVLYADILCDTGNYSAALNMLDTVPFIYSADAEFIRAKSYYRMNTEESVANAREKINSARRIYQNDTRFARLFFKYEYEFLRSQGTLALGTFAAGKIQLPDLTRRIADAFIAKMPTYDNPDAELEVYALLFAEGERQKRLLEAFTAHNQRHPLYVNPAIKHGLISQLDAVDYFFSFGNTPINYSYLVDFVSLITEKEARTYLAKNLDGFGGTLVFDTNGDLEMNMVVDYVRGRPETIKWDRNSDDVLEWTVKCDFGVPVSAVLGNDSLMVEYGTYPAIISASLIATEFGGSYQYADESFFWTPCSMEVPKQFASLDGCTFFVPRPIMTDGVPAPEMMILSSSHYAAATHERENGEVMFALSKGKPVTAEYTVGGAIYAHAVFENGLPTVRSVDNDGDGIFETTQFFGYDPENLLHQLESERAALREQIFNLPEFPAGIYLRMVQTDTDGDAVPDFSEEYLADGGRISSWDTNRDGEWDMRYHRFPRGEGEDLREDSLFYKIPGNVLVTVVSINGKPVEVVSDGISVEVFAGVEDRFYWIGSVGSDEIENEIIDISNRNGRQGVSLVYEKIIESENDAGNSEKSNSNIAEKSDEINTVRFFVVRIGDTIFAEKVD